MVCAMKETKHSGHVKECSARKRNAERSVTRNSLLTMRLVAVFVQPFQWLCAAFSQQVKTRAHTTVSLVFHETI